MYIFTEARVMATRGGLEKCTTVVCACAYTAMMCFVMVKKIGMYNFSVTVTA